MEQKYYTEDELVQMYQDGKISLVEYISMHSERVTGTGSVDPHARHCRAVDGTQSLVSGICPTLPWALGRWIVRLCHTVLFFWAQMQKKTASKLFLLKLHSVHFSVVTLSFHHRDSLDKWVNGTCPLDLLHRFIL